MVCAIVPAAGAGQRMGGATRKPFLSLCGLPVLVHVLMALQKTPCIDTVACVVSVDDLQRLRQIVADYALTKVTRMLPGGEHRQASVRAALTRMESTPNDIILIHDGARPMVTPALITQVTEAALRFGAASAVLPLADSVKEVTDDRFVKQSLVRETLRAVHTPQAFRLGLLLRAHLQAETSGYIGTDDAGLVEQLGEPVYCVDSFPENIKITTPHDLSLAQWFLQGREAC